MILDVCKASSIKVMFFISNNCTSAESNSKINFFNFLNLCFFIDFELTVIFMKTINLTLIETETLIILNYLSFSSIYIIHSLSSLSFENFVSKCLLLIFIKKHHYISYFFVFAHCFLYRRLLQSVSLFFII